MLTLTRIGTVQHERYTHKPPDLLREQQADHHHVCWQNNSIKYYILTNKKIHYTPDLLCE